MKALVFHRTKSVRVETVPDPRIENARDAILRVSLASICGADLGVYNGRLHPGRPLILGREFLGVVVEIGPRVRGLKKGDRVVVPSSIACGECFYCVRGRAAQCEKTDHSAAGGQAQYARVPFADAGARRAPDGLSDERALLLGDTVPAGWTAARRCGLKGGETVAVFGCGPVGLMAMRCARLQGAGRVIAVDALKYRRDAARRAAGAEPVDPEAEDPVEAVRRMTDGRGADACIDAAGEEDGRGFAAAVSGVLRLRTGAAKALRCAVAAVRPGGAVAAVGATGAGSGDVPIDEVFEKGLSLSAGPTPVQDCIDELLWLAAAGRLAPEELVTHRFPLDEAPEAYEIADENREECLKIVLDPWREAVEEEHSVESDELDSEPPTGLPADVLPPTIL